MWFFTSLLLLVGGTWAAAVSEDTVSLDREGKLLPIFQVVKFQNEFCTSTSTSRNGTCYTASECANRGGTRGSECAEGFGVCCSFELSCGGSSSENATYIINTSMSESCTYTICPVSTNICRVRFDFETFSISDPVLGTAAATAVKDQGGAIGDCAYDQFQISGPNRGSPVICGTNTGQHMVLDSDGSTCHTVQAIIDTAVTATRSLTIHVSQYTCQNPYSGGPPGCLQYHYNPALATTVTGAISNFGYDRSSTSVGVTTTHLSNQHYNICIRRPSGCHAICYTPSITIAFGLSTSPTAATAQAASLSNCYSDYIMIPGGSAQGTATLYQESSISATTAPTLNKLCGRFMGTDKATASVSVCTRLVPFVIGVYTDGDEITEDSGADMAQTNEQGKIPGGIVGFSLTYALQC